MKIKLQIKNKFTGSLIFEYEKEDNTIKETLLEAKKSGANLSGANLSRADLSGAYLSVLILTPIAVETYKLTKTIDNAN